MDSGIDNDKHAHIHKENDYGIERLLSKVQKGHHHGKPHFNTLSGDPTPTNASVSYVQWAFEVQSAKDQYPEGVLKEGIV